MGCRRRRSWGHLVDTTASHPSNNLQECVRRTVQKSTRLIRNSAVAQFLRHSALAAFQHALNAKRRNIVSLLSPSEKVLEELVCLYGLLDAADVLILVVIEGRNE